MKLWSRAATGRLMRNRLRRQRCFRWKRSMTSTKCSLPMVNTNKLELQLMRLSYIISTLIDRVVKKTVRPECQEPFAWQLTTRLWSSKCHVFPSVTRCLYSGAAEMSIAGVISLVWYLLCRTVTKIWFLFRYRWCLCNLSRSESFLCILDVWTVYFSSVNILDERIFVRDIAIWGFHWGVSVATSALSQVIIFPSKSKSYMYEREESSASSFCC